PPGAPRVGWMRQAFARRSATLVVASQVRSVGIAGPARATRFGHRAHLEAWGPLIAVQKLPRTATCRSRRCRGRAGVGPDPLPDPFARPLVRPLGLHAL